MRLEELSQELEDGTIDTVLLAITDMQGRLARKRLVARFFLEEIGAHGAEGCDYLLAVGVGMNAVDGCATAPWERGHGDFLMRLGLSTPRRVPWQETTAPCLGDVVWGDGSDGAALPRQVLRAQLRRLEERGWTALPLAPHVSSYKRYAAGPFAPTAIAWGHDNRTCALRVVGRGAGLRFENRSGGADLDAYLALRALIAAGRHGVEAGLALERVFEGNGYTTAGPPRLPSTPHEARALFAASPIARDAFCEQLVADYVNAANVELAAIGRAVADWERYRGFERL